MPYPIVGTNLEMNRKDFEGIICNSGEQNRFGGDGPEVRWLREFTIF